MEEKNGGLNLRRVAVEESGEGLPYAPENWPEPGDIWGWRTGRRVASNGNFHDRYLYLPIRLCPPSALGSSGSSSGSTPRKKRLSFASKLAVERYIKANFPHADLAAFFASFNWKIPAISPSTSNGPIAAVPLQQIPQAEHSDSDTDVVKCKAGNKMCDSLITDEAEKYSPAMPCDICCDEPGFCRDCCCILCCKTVTSDYGGYSYIKCGVKFGDGICGHVAHMECALRSRMAGTVGRSIGLDAEYHCRRCDGRTDLISHVNKLVQTCKAIDLDGEIQKKILNLGACLLRGSQKAVAKELLNHIELAISKVFLNDFWVIEITPILLVLSYTCVKAYDQSVSLHQLKCGTNLEDIWKVDNLNAHTTDHGNDPMEMESTVNEPSLKLEAEIDQVLNALRKSQEYEYKLAEETLQAHKTYLQNLYQQLDSEKSELASQNSSGSDAIRQREEQIRREEMKLEVMKKVANGFGRTNKDILKECFGLEISD